MFSKTVNVPLDLVPHAIAKADELGIKDVDIQAPYDPEPIEQLKLVLKINGDDQEKVEQVVREIVDL